MTKIKFLPLALTISLALTGCAWVPAHYDGLSSDGSPSPEVAPRETGSGLGENAALESPDVWFSRWHDENLKKVVDSALKNSTDIASSLADLRSARASLIRTTSTLFPSAELGADVSRRRQNHATVKSYSADASGAWTLSFGGKELAERRSAAALADAAQLTLEDTRQAVAAEAAGAYVRLALAKEKLKLAKENESYYRDTFNLAREQYAAGTIAREDLDSLEAQYHSAASSASETAQSLLAAQTALAALTHLPLSGIMAMDPKVIPEPDDGLAARISADALNNRADVRAARLAVIAAMEDVSASEAAFLPSLSLTGSFGTAAAALSALGTSGTSLGVLAAGLSVPILNWGSTYASTETQKAALDKAKAKYAGTLFSAAESAENALGAISSSSARRASLVRAEKSAASANLIATEKYKTGLGDYLSVLETRRSLNNARTSLASARADRSLAHIDLYRALGGGWVPLQKE